MSSQIKVCVVNKNGFPLMPTTPRKARKLLENSKARIYSRRPFTIQLLHGCRGYTQPITLGVDAGYQTVGYSAVTQQEELVGGEFKLLEGMSERLTERRQYRRTRRNRLRYRKPKFDNRRRKEGWLAPSIGQKLDSGCEKNTALLVEEGNSRATYTLTRIHLRLMLRIQGVPLLPLPPLLFFRSAAV